MLSQLRKQSQAKQGNAKSKDGRKATELLIAVSSDDEVIAKTYFLLSTSLLPQIFCRAHNIAFTGTSINIFKWLENYS